MTGDRSEAAVQRIEAALARIARASDVRAPQPGETAAPATNVLALVEKHERLRETVAQAIADLDSVITEFAP